MIDDLKSQMNILDDALRINADERFIYFKQTVCEWSEVWMLYSKENDYALIDGESDKTKVMLFPLYEDAKAYKEMHDELADYLVIPHDIYDFVDNLIDICERKGIYWSAIYPSAKEEPFYMPLEILTEHLDFVLTM